LARISGKDGRLYAGIATSAANAEPIAFLNKWTLSMATEKFDATAFGDTNKVKTSGHPDATGSYTGWYDTETAQLLTAAQDGDARKFYLYPTTDEVTKYFFGTAVFDFSVDVGTGATASVSGSFEAASSVAKVG
jgi:hypothetical protein